MRSTAASAIRRRYIIDKKTGIVRRKFIGPQVWTSPEICCFCIKNADGRVARALIRSKL